MYGIMYREVSPHFSPGGGMIAQGFGFTRDFLKERNINAYFRLKNYLVDSMNKREPVILVRNAG